MGRRTIIWGRIVEICKRRGIEISERGSEKKLKGSDREGNLRMMIIGHECSRGKNSDVWPDYVAAFKRRFGVSDEELYGD